MVYTFVATVSAIVHCGRASRVDRRGAGFQYECRFTERAITPKTKALPPSHLNGRICEMDRILALADKHGLAVIEDAAQALGATFRTASAPEAKAARVASASSIQSARRVRGTGRYYERCGVCPYGDTSAITGEDRATGEYHYHGRPFCWTMSRLPVLDVKLRHLPEWIAHRRRIAAAHHRGLSGITQLRTPQSDEVRRKDIFQNYVIRTRSVINYAPISQNRGSRRWSIGRNPCGEHWDWGLLR